MESSSIFLSKNFLFFLKLSQKNDEWRRNLLIKLDNTTTIYYKYIVGYDDGSQIQAIRWEEGPTRILNLKNTTRLLIKICI